MRHLHTGPADRAPALHPTRPSGEQLMTAVVAAAPLFSASRPQQETTAAYLKDLQAALTQADQRNVRLATDVLPIGVAAR